MTKYFFRSLIDWLFLDLATRSGDLASTVMVPNSLGPAELLMHYGTEEQRNH